MVDFQYNIIRKDIKNARLRVSEDMSVTLYIPANFDENSAIEIIERRKYWIEKRLLFFKNKTHITLLPNELLLFGCRYSYFYSSEHPYKVVVNHISKKIEAKRDLTNFKVQEEWLKRIARKHFEQRIKFFSETFNLPYNKLFVRCSKFKWGNCSTDKNISLNWKLIKAPKFVIDYVIVHELLHTVLMKHTVKFKTLLRTHYPDYQQAIDWLNKYGNSL